MVKVFAGASSIVFYNHCSFLLAFFKSLTIKFCTLFRILSWPSAGKAQGPVVQSIFSLTSALRGQLVQFFMNL